MGAPPARLSGWRRWLLLALVAILLPLALLAAIELALVAGRAGHPAGFFVALPDRDAETTNPRFGWRFFPPAIARSPVVGLLPRPKPPGAYRIFVLGGSAAMGTPEPALGFGPILEVLLEERYPGLDFEVVNAAMAAINSHVVVEVARDCARREPDLFAVYLGNNEVVGPWGPGTVFGPVAPGRTTIRLGLALRRLRTGQLLGRALAAARPAAATPARWRGMEMFLDRQVAEDDPRLERSHAHLEANLRALARIAAGTGAALLVSTVAVDLRDTPPFASLHRSDLTAAELARWRGLVERGSEAAAGGRFDEAADAFAAALAIDDRHAELHYRIGRLHLLAGRPAPARRHLERARDLDALRFRADRRTNETIRRAAAAAPDRLRLVDAERRLAEAPEARDGLPGRGLFWEHVHLRFAGNYRLAEAFLEALEPLLPEAVRGRTAAPSPSLRQVAERLALTARDRREMAATIYEMTRRPPFTGQLGHEARRAAARRELHALAARAEAEAEATLEAYRTALARRPDDLLLGERLARALDEHGPAAAAVGRWRELTGRIPIVAGWQTRLGFALAAAGQLAAAEEALRRALELAPESAEPRVNLATHLADLGRGEAAERLYREALAIDPASEPARLNLADLLERADRVEQAEGELRRLLALDPSSAAGYRRLGELYDRRGEPEPAIAAYRKALTLDPELVAVRNNLGYALAGLGRRDEAAREYLRTLADDPRYALAWFNLGDLLLESGRAGEAAEAYRAGLALEPDNGPARANLARAEAVVERGPEPRTPHQPPLSG